MRQVKIESENVYYHIGLQALLDRINEKERGDRPSPDISCHNNDKVSVSVLFKDFMARIDIAGRPSVTIPAVDMRACKVIHVPFFCKGYTLDECHIKIKRILELATLEDNAHSGVTLSENPRLKKLPQLSPAENNVTALIGKGKTVKCISGILKRSERTIGTHCRNAINKMGMDNRLDFYRYAFYIEQFGGQNAITVCL